MSSEPGSRPDASVTWIRSETGQRPQPAEPHPSEARPEPRPAEPAFADAPRYADGARLGEGGMGEVDVQHDRWLGRDVARKRLRPERTGQEAVQRFVLEARVMGRLEHPNIVPVYDAGVDEDGPWFSMRRIDGESLQTLLLEGRLGTRVRRLEIFHKVCDALHYAHSQGVVHRDVKPGNVMIGAHGAVLLLDWGCARVRGAPDLPPLSSDSGGSSDSGLTRQDAVLGTPGYMAPEQALGQLDQIGERTDVYALGALLYALLTDTPPYPKGMPNVLERVRSGVLDPPRSRDPELSWELEAVILKAMAWRPADRFDSVEALQAAVVAVQEGRELAFVRYGVGHRLARLARRHRRTLAAAGAALVGLGFAVGLAASLYIAGLRSSLDQVRAAERQSATRLAREQVALALAEGRAGRIADARERLVSARALLERLGESPVPVDAADAWLADLAPPPTLSVRAVGRGSLWMALSDDGAELLVARDNDGTRVAMMRLPDGAVEARVDAPPARGQRVVGAWFWRGRPVVAWSDERGVELRGLDGAALGRVDGPADRVLLAGDAVFVAEGDGTRVHSLPDGALARRLSGSPVAASRDGTRLVTATGSNSPAMTAPDDVRVWDVASGRELWRGPFLDGLALSPDGRRLALGRDGEVQLLELATGRVAARAPGADGDVPLFSGDGATLVVLHDQELRFLDAATLALRGTRSVGGAVLRSSAELGTDLRGERVLTQAAGDVRVWSRADGPTADDVDGGEELRSVAVSPDGVLVAVGGMGGELRLFERRSGARLLAAPTAPQGTRDVGFAADGSAVFTADRDGSVRRFVLGAEGPPDVLAVGCGLASAVVPLGPDRALAACATGSVVVASVGGGVEWRLDGLGPIWDAVEVPSGVVITNRDAQHPLATLIDLETHGTRVLDPERRVTYRATASEDGRWLAFGDHEGAPRVLPFAAPGPPRALPTSAEVVMAVALSPDGSVLVAGDYSGVAHFVDVARGEELGAFELHGAEIAQLAWVPGTRALLSVAGDGRIRQLDLDAGPRAAAVGVALPLGTAPGGGAAQLLDLARLAEQRGTWSEALGLYGAAAAEGGEVRHVDLARALTALGERSAALAQLEFAEQDREVSPGTLAAWKRALQRSEEGG